MYAETGLMYPYFQKLSQEIQPLEELCCYSQEPTSSLDSIITTSTISDYDLGGEGDLFKAPEPIIEEPIGSLDPMTAAIAMISSVEDSGLKVSDMESLQNEQLLCDVFDGCQNELLEKTTSMETAVSDVLDIKFPLMMTNEVQTEENKSLPALPFSKSGSSGSLNSMEWVSSAAIRPNFLDFPELDFGAAYGMRRAFSEGDIKTLANGNVSLIQSTLQRPLLIGSCTSEDRLQKLSRYRNKRSRRNFGRKIKYACRKALADSQPRIRGRFAKTEDPDCKKQ
ncbi:putative zinc finger protein CONSTANS-LIKE 11 [Chenopodium quinoa]|uniref:CCT domain-containing protein n=1 Tax=Chenopodium quinoa TaxID=63459 RepID=A0A803L2L5_CHEQI|nr:putative zinc finger protein CONSTANS-LIKE 11 [Chenopodium quinoa]